ncbi:hypothetical protein [Reinekea marinisedimentorum]|uniref:Uncharacterized protein n=1 Tax=Reinekea marinisedimentorum TaxID=230495 RepID=A0A4R3IB30_9GAMM|nr:hypothetical protein [Reinekea marinisedimentorum]TCS43661.1 hypothetical protein BCF53_1013 [Reinekea marinisedimentorum]
MEKKILSVALAIAAVTLSSCGSESGGGESADITSLKDLAGVYDDSDSYEDGTVDEYFILVRENGSVASFDYAGDSYDDYDDCYWIFDDEDTLTHVSGSTFYSEYNDENVTVTSEGSKYTFSTGSESFSMVKTNMIEADLTPECDY